MRRPALIILIVLAMIAVSVPAWLPVSGASFTSASSSSIRVSTDTIHGWLHLYSQATDPGGLGDYWLCEPTTAPAAAGSDGELTVDLGTYPAGRKTTCMRVFTIQAPASFPTGTEVTVTASLLPDAASGAQPVLSVGMPKVGKSHGLPNPATLAAGQKLQVNLRVEPDAAGVTYHPRIVLTLTYAGMTAAYYQYVIPLTVTGI